RSVSRASEASTIDDMEREMILQALADLDGNQVRAAERLGISDRTIRNKLKKYREEGHID
ncbi:MAG: helix-turn-helix domain-containing protein, partial [Polyangiales bacterium]